jgi:hypothetical protein
MGFILNLSNIKELPNRLKNFNLEVNTLATFLDYRLSENSSTFGFPNTVMSQSAINPDNIGNIGLIVGNAGNIRVDLSGLIGVQTSVSPAIIVLTIIRNSAVPTAPDAGIIIFKADYAVPAGSTITIAIHAVDFNPTINPFIQGQLTYGLFAQAAGGAVIRTGPENFSGFAVTG